MLRLSPETQVSGYSREHLVIGLHAGNVPRSLGQKAKSADIE